MTRKPTTISFFANAEKRESLRKIAETLNKTVSEVINEALDRYIDVHEWQVRHIQKGVKAAEEGNLASDEEIDEFFEEYCEV